MWQALSNELLGILPTPYPNCTAVQDTLCCTLQHCFLSQVITIAYALRYMLQQQSSASDVFPTRQLTDQYVTIRLL